MNELIHIYENDGQYSNGRQAVSARELYEKLEFAPQHWANWYKKNILKNEFAIEGEDYIQLPLSGRTLDFALSLNFAKKLSMRANTAKGDEVRDYFIEREKISYQHNQTPLSSAQQFLMVAQINVEQERRLKEQEFRLNSQDEKIKQLEAKTATQTGDYYSVIGYGVLKGIKVDSSFAKSLSCKAKKLSKERNILVSSTPDPRFGRVNIYHKDVLEIVFTNTSYLL